MSRNTVTSPVGATTPSQDHDQIAHLPPRPRRFGNSLQHSELTDNQTQAAPSNTAPVTYTSDSKVDASQSKLHQTLLDECPQTSLRDIPSILNITNLTSLIDHDEGGTARWGLNLYLAQFTSPDPLTRAIGESPGTISEDERITDNSRLLHAKIQAESITQENSLVTNRIHHDLTQLRVQVEYRDILKSLCGKYNVGFKEDLTTFSYVDRSNGKAKSIPDKLDAEIQHPLKLEDIKKSLYDISTQTEGGKSIEDIDIEWKKTTDGWSKAIKTHTEDGIKERMRYKPQKDILSRAIDLSTRYTKEEKMCFLREREMSRERVSSTVGSTAEEGRSVVWENLELEKGLMDRFKVEIKQIEKRDKVKLTSKIKTFFGGRGSGSVAHE